MKREENINVKEKYMKKKIKQMSNTPYLWVVDAWHTLFCLITHKCRHTNDAWAIHMQIHTCQTVACSLGHKKLIIIKQVNN